MSFRLTASTTALLLAAVPACHHALLRRERSRLTPNGKLIPVGGHALHIYTEGARAPGAPALIFLSGGGTPDPAYNFRSLYRLLSPDYQIAVVEKPGYGYAPVARAPRDVDTLLSETREALLKAGIAPPYVLFPHSFSGMEALRWAQRYPQELWGLVGLDMAVPEIYRYIHVRAPLRALMGAAGWLGLQRLPFVSPTDRAPLTAAEYRQSRLLNHQNFMNPNVLAEVRSAHAGADLVAAGPTPRLPALLFSTAGKGIGPFWVPCQRRFAEAVGGTLRRVDCGHYLHNLIPEALAEECRAFLRSLSTPTDC